MLFKSLSHSMKKIFVFIISVLDSTLLANAVQDDHDCSV